MQYFCPLCMENGVKSRVRPYQLNFKEGMWMCERVKNCVWPIGYEDLTFFERDAFNCDWTKDPPNLPKSAISLLSELSLYTPPMTPGDGESSKETNDIENAKCSSDLSAKNVLSEIYHENEFAGSMTDCNNLLNQKGTSTEESQNIGKDKSVNASPLKAEFNNFQNTDFATLPSINESYDNQIEDSELLYVNTTLDLDRHVTKDFNVIDNPHKESHPKIPNEQTNDSSNEYSKKSKENESREMQLNNIVNSSDNNIKMLLLDQHLDNMPGTDSVQSKNLRIILDSMIIDWKNYCSLPEQYQRIMDNYAKRSRLFTVINITFTMLSVIGYASTPIMNTWLNNLPWNQTSRYLPNEGFYPFPIQSSPTFELLYLMQTYILFLCGMAMSAIDCFLYIIVFHACGQFDLLAAILQQYGRFYEHNFIWIWQKDPSISSFLYNYLGTVLN